MLSFLSVSMVFQWGEVYIIHAHVDVATNKLKWNIIIPSLLNRVRNWSSSSLVGVHAQFMEYNLVH
jgi:hypothetical protein